MTPIVEALSRLPSRPFGTLVHLGAGDGLVLEAYEVLAPRRVVLVEGDPDAGAELRRLAAAHTWAEVHTCAVAPTAGPVSWHRFNLPAFNGPRQAAGLGAFYPRLRETGQLALQAVALADLLAALPAREPDDGERWLVMDLPGQEDALLHSLSDDLLRGFDGLLLRGCAAPAAGAAGTQTPTQAQAVASLQARGYRVAATLADAEPLWPVTVLEPDPSAMEARRLRAELRLVARQLEQAITAQQAEQAEAARLREALAAAEAGRDEQAQRVEAGKRAQVAAVRERDEARAALQAQQAELVRLRETVTAIELERDEQVRLVEAGKRPLTTALRERDEARSALQSLQAEHERLRAALSTAELERDEQVRRVEAGKRPLTTAIRERDESQAALQTLQTEQARLRECLASAQTVQDEHARLADARRRQLDVAIKERNEARQELAEARRTAALSVKLQALREADLRDLQARYQAAQTQRQSQHELLAKLSQRLAVANQYFQQLSLEQQREAGRVDGPGAGSGGM